MYSSKIRVHTFNLSISTGGIIGGYCDRLLSIQDLIFLELLRCVKTHVNLICQVLEEEETVHGRSRPVNYLKISIHIRGRLF